MMKHKRKMEFSKKLLIAFAVVEIFVVIFSCAVILITLDSSPIYYMLSTIALEVSAGTGFYYWKAKNENRYKYAQSFVKDIANVYGIDMAVRMAEVVLKE